VEINDFSYCINKSTYEDIIEHLKIVDSCFIPQLSSTVNLEDYGKKLYKFSERFECWNSNKLIGLIAIYTNLENISFSYITNVSVYEVYSGFGIAKNLMLKVIHNSKMKKISKIDLHVNQFNKKAIGFYEKHLFKIKSQVDDRVLMSISL
jgi:ribosomal protein S18 acetylase RimI-like enzyme